ncbi:beige BEACH domain-containing protein [Aspergillus sclerotialis]|uniref:Beige BEACH domain-containing protein n=1 Tax=Aspergillus sclerotialis TaxID=2070753 RepID=A0A3A2ZN64_9EURO|nr:beige BEACH domain-containing protein [Aspergillus sclerotialis]
MNRSTSVSSPPSLPTEHLAAEFTPIITQLKSCSAADTINSELAGTATECLLRLRHTFIDNENPSEAKNTFRHLHGFQSLLQLLRKISELYDAGSLSKEERKSFLTLYKDTLGVLAESLKDHFGNKRYFAKQVANGGKEMLEGSMLTLANKIDGVEEDAEQLYGGILAAASVKKQLREYSQRDLRAAVDRCIGLSETVEVPELLGPFLRIWLIQSEGSSEYKIQRLTLPTTLQQLASQSQRNVVALHATGMLTSVLPVLFNSERPEIEKSIYHDLAKLLYVHGMDSLDGAVYLYRRAHDSPEVLRFLLDVLKSSKEPPSIQFDMSLHGFCSLEFSTLGRTFPPAASSGYTLSVWARFDHFDPSTHTTIFGAFDPSQSCFMLAYIEKDTRHFILQTSIKGPRPSVRFKSVTFEPSRWYHVALVHRKPKPHSSSRAALFIDGEFVEQLKIEYPYVPPPGPSIKTPRVQAFFGTPQDLAMRLGKAVSTSRWSLASGILFDEAYSDDTVSIFYNIGARYYGNFQDSLGSFQTYKASAALNLRNELLHPGKEEHSDIVTAIRRKAGVLVRESSILVNVSPVAVLNDGDNNNVDEAYLAKSLSRQAAKNLHQLTKAGGNAVVVNGGIPAVNDALTKAHGVGILTGDPVVSVPQPLDDASWRIGGCAAVHLSLVHAAKTAESTLLAVEALYEAVQDNWRNSEAMERENGYGILAALLSEKLGFPLGNSSMASKTSIACSTYKERSALALKLLRLTLKFVGYNFEFPNRSIITNPLAYRVLLVDLEIWRSGEFELLELYYSQFSTFATGSQFRRFNAKRLTRMRVSKKLLEALKREQFTEEALRLFTSAYKSLMESYFSAELHRSLALFITYSLHKPIAPAKLQKKKSLRFNTALQQFPASPDHSETYVSSTTVAIAMLRMYSSFLCNYHDQLPLKRFARAVTNKWLLYLMCEDEPEIVVQATKIVARLIIVHGSAYSKKLSEKTGGYVIMRHRLKRWWNVPAIWPICFAILFGHDVGHLDDGGSFDDSYIPKLISSDANTRIVFPEMLPVITNMMQSGVKKAVLSSSPDADGKRPLHEQLDGTMKPHLCSYRPLNSTIESISLMTTVIDVLAETHLRSLYFRDFAANSSYVQELLFVIFPAVVGSDIVSADIELSSRDSGFGLDSQNSDIRPGSSPAPILRTTTVEHSSVPDERGGRLRRGSSFILVSSDKAKYLPSYARLRHIDMPKQNGNGSDLDNPIVNRILDLLVDIFADQVLERKEFTGLGIYLKAPPGFMENQTLFGSWLLRNLLSSLHDVTTVKSHLLLEPRTLTNLGRFATHLGEALYEGWFINGATSIIDFLGAILEFLQRPDISHLKSIRLCSQAIGMIRSTLFRAVLFELSGANDADTIPFLGRLTYWQAVLFSTSEAQSEYLHLLCYLLYIKLISTKEDVRLAAAGLWRVVLVQKPTEMSSLLSHTTAALHERLSGGFEALAGMEDLPFLQWIDEHRDDLDALFFGVLSKSWESFVHEENKKSDDSSRTRASKRHDKMKQWSQTEKLTEDIIRKHEVTFPHWISNITASEFLKYQRSLQDQQDNLVFMWSAFSHLSIDLRRFGGLLAEDKERKWRLDQTEGRSRMRLRVVPDDSGERQDYQPKRKASEPPAIKIDTKVPGPSGEDTLTLTPTAFTGEAAENNSQSVEPDNKSVLEESFEIVDDPKIDLEDYEDKNRKVMRSLHRGDQVQNVCNMSRIIGLEACEGLLILGKDHIYILDNFFQRSDGEIVNVWQAPPEEQDPYVRMISGRESSERKPQEHETRSWKWSDVISVSKRRFLFRNVALEIFFTDGSSYLLTLISPRVRDELCSQLGAKAPQVTGSISHSRPEDIWRFETLRSQEDAPLTLGSKVASVFGHSPAHPATRKWVRGEISNFHYLMLVNTLAGRTFNDLTQYPVFPWVLADYTSEELDLTNPKTFRDLSKPMGCQTLERENEFRERYKAFAEMGDDNAPPFHYGTHYSSAMIVTSYLIRLQPFVKSYLLMQGGTFDHADRLFYSVRKAWESASRGGMSDVRELIPEFFYLPEFLVNANKYDFGLLQNMTTAIDSVELPPWAKGDPKIFIAKHREALESPYVSQNLHYWIDLVFGCKQKGDAALEAVNIFHHLSYQGAKDVDNIDDPVERLATIGIIHNFGQTPHQIFSRPHPQREEQRYRVPRLDQLAESLTQLPISLLDIDERVSSLAMKNDRLLCTPALRINIPPAYDRYMERGYTDGSVRFYTADTRKLLGHFEHLHVGQLSCAVFADSRTLVTAGMDCTVSLWTYTSTGKSVDLQPTGSLFGHRCPVTILAVSRSFSTLLSASSDGQIMLWDLNRQCFVREIPASGPVDCARINDATGDIVVCRGNRMALYTLNGALLLEQAACDSADDSVLTCVFYESVNNEWLERDLLFTGHKRGVVNIWTKTISNGRFELDLIRQLHHTDNTRDNGANISAGISCILPLPTVVYTGDEAGRVLIMGSMSGIVFNAAEPMLLRMRFAEFLGLPLYPNYISSSTILFSKLVFPGISLVATYHARETVLP